MEAYCFFYVKLNGFSCSDRMVKIEDYTVEITGSFLIAFGLAGTKTTSVYLYKNGIKDFI